MEDYIWTAAAVEKELELGQGRVARVFRDILDKLQFREEEKAWYRAEPSKTSEEPAGDAANGDSVNEEVVNKEAVNRGNYIFGGCNAPQDIKQLFAIFEKREKITEHTIITLKYLLFDLLPQHRDKSNLREMYMHQRKEEFYQLHDLLMQLRSLNIIGEALDQKEELNAKYGDILSKKQVKELEQVAKMVEKCCGYSVANEKPDNPVKWLEEGRRRIGCSAVIDRRVEAYFAGCFRDFYFEKQIWVKQEKDKGRPWKALYSEMYKAVEKWHHRWMRIMTVAKEVRESENGEYRNTYSLCKIAMEGVQEEAFIGKTITNGIKKDLWQEWCEKLVDEILSHKLRRNYEEDYNYMLIRAFLELNDIHDKIAKEQQKYCPELQEIIPKPSSESSLGTFYEAIFRQYK